ncbi:MAG: hypothetical protein ACRDU4_07255, partial [Mycobacterium sp.]
AAWRGPGADSAAGFLRGHCDAGAALAAAVRAAAEACGVLRDELWRLIDDKVATAVGIDDRTCTQRPVWLAAAHTVTAAAGNTQAAEDVVDHQVKPYVDNDIRTDWLTAMRSARNSVAAAYDAATAAVAPRPGVVLPIPGEIGPRYQPDEQAPPVPVVPAAAVAPPVDPPSARPDPVSPIAAPLEDPLSAPLGDAAGWPADAGLPSDFGMPAGAGLPTGAGNLGGLIPRIADAIGSLLGSPDDGLTDEGLDEPLDDESDDESDDEPEDESDEPDGPDDEPDESEPVADEPEPTEPADEVAADAPTDDAVAAPANQQVAPPPSDTPEERSDAAGSTPCEIAADELPQVGQ